MRTIKRYIQDIASTNADLLPERFKAYLETYQEHPPNVIDADPCWQFSIRAGQRIERYWIDRHTLEIHPAD